MKKIIFIGNRKSKWSFISYEVLQKNYDVTWIDETPDLLPLDGFDLGVSVAYPKLIPKSVLDNLNYTFINLHASLLPDLKGHAPVNWAILMDKEYTGITIHIIDEIMDNGPILFQDKTKIEKDDTISTLMDKIYSLIIDNLNQVVTDYLDGKITLIKQNPSGDEFYGWRRYEIDSKINFNSTQKEIIQLAKASGFDYPIFFDLNGKKFYPKSVKITKINWTPALNGRIVRRNKDFVTVSVRDGFVDLYFDETELNDLTPGIFLE